MSNGIYHPSHLVPSNQMAYVLNTNPIANAVLNSVNSSSQSCAQKSSSSGNNNNNNNSTNNEAELHNQVGGLQDQNRTLSKRLHSKTMENGKLERRIEKLENEIDSYKRLLSDINQSINDGEMSSNSQAINFALQTMSVGGKLSIGAIKATKGGKSAGKSRKTKSSSNCHCCCDVERPFVCDWPDCGKRFRQKPHLEAHKNIHTGKRFHCEYPQCDKSFVRKYNLMEHTKLHSSVNPNMCTYPKCNEIFSSKYSLVRHQNAQHKLII